MSKYLVLKVIFAAALVTLLACSQDQPKVSSAPVSEPEAEHFELAVAMGRLQIYLEKAYWSGVNKNDALHEFYIHELEETMEDVIKAGVMEDGVNISYNMQQYGVKALEAYEGLIANDGFKDLNTNFSNLVNGCNSCHMVSKKPFVKIQIPEVNRFPSQLFIP